MSYSKTPSVFEIEVENIYRNFMNKYMDNCCDVYYRCDETNFYDSEYDYIMIGDITNRRGDELFVEFCRDEFNFTDSYSIYTITFLHELGHYMTLDDFSAEDYIEWNSIVNFCGVNKEQNGGELSDDLHMAYYNTAIEYAATAWAISYVRNNFESIEELDELLTKCFS